MVGEIAEIIETLEPLLEDLPLKIRISFDNILHDLKQVDENNLDVNRLMKIQDEMEVISNMSNLDSFTRNEIMNSIAVIESIYNG